MLPLSVFGYLPHIGILLLFIGLIFAVVAAMDVPTESSLKKNPSSASSSLGTSRYAILAYAFILSGGFVFVGPLH